jgi:nucleotide-binding universal stress UspA family protein
MRFRECRIGMSMFLTKILLATDGSEEADLALKTAVNLASNTDSDPHVVLVEELPYAYDAPAVRSPESGFSIEVHKRTHKQLDRELEKVRSAGGRVAEAHLRVGTAAREIVALAEEIGAGLIVMGSRGFGGVRRRLWVASLTRWSGTPTARLWWCAREPNGAIPRRHGIIGRAWVAGAIRE